MGRKCSRGLPSFAELRRRKGCRLLRWTWGRIRMLGEREDINEMSSRLTSN